MERPAVKIKTKAIAGAVISIALTLVICALLVITTSHIHDLNVERRQAISLTEEILNLHSFALDYSLSPGKKIQGQMKQACDRIGGSLAALEKKFHGTGRDTVLRRIRDANTAATTLISRLGQGGVTLAGNETLLSDSDKRIMHEVWNESEKMLQGAETVRDLTVVEHTAAESKIIILIIVFTIVIALIVIGMTLLTLGSVTKPLLELDKGTRVIADGNLEYQVDEGRKDEMGDLARSFNRMAERLKDSFTELETEVNERKRAERALEEKNEELEGFAHTVSHDLKGPMAAIGYAAQTLDVLLARPVEDRSKADIEEIARIIDGNVTRAGKLIDDILALAEAGQVPEGVTDVDMKEVVDGILQENQWIIERGHIEVRVDEDLGRVSANPTHVYQVFSNLVSNAIKYNDNAEPIVVISYIGEDEDGGHRYRVRDNGSGITDDELDKLFVPFFKGRKGDTGIGLATVAKIVGVYEGSIRAYNESGACFEFVMKDFE